MTVVDLADAGAEVGDVLTATEAAELLRMKPQTLAIWRMDRKNLPFVRAGRRVLYRRRDLLEFLERQLVPVAGLPEALS